MSQTYTIPNNQFYSKKIKITPSPLSMKPLTDPGHNTDTFSNSSRLQVWTKEIYAQAILAYSKRNSSFCYKTQIQH